MVQDVSVEFVDGALGVPSIAAQGGKVNAHVGPCSAGAVNTLFAFTTLAALVAALGTGPLVEAMAYDIDELGIAYGVRVTSTAAATPTFAQSGSGPVITITGNPLDAYQLVLKPVLGGVRGTATFIISFDGGDTWSDVITTAATITAFAASTGLTFAFATGTPYVSGELYTVNCAMPTYTSGNLITAIQAVYADAKRNRLVHVVGTTTGGTAAADFATLAAAVQTEVEAHATNGDRFSRAIMEAPDATDGDLVTAAASVNMPRIVPVAGYAEVYSVLTKRWYKRNLAGPIAARVARIPEHVRAGRVKDGPLPAKVRKLYRDERITPGLAAARYTTCLTREKDGVVAIYVGKVNTWALPGSDYAKLERCQVIDKAATLFVAIASEFIDDHDLEVKADGTLTEQQAKDLDAYIGGRISQIMVQTDKNCLGVTVKTSRTQNLVTTEILAGEVRVFSRAYVSGVAYKVGFRPPELSFANAA